jgi:hypothetical protein
VQAHQSRQLLADYLLTDREILAKATSPVIYYRLLQADQDGSTTLSHVIALNNSTSPGAAVSLYPNPAHDRIAVTGITEHTHMEIYDISGVLCFSGTPAATPGGILLDISSLKAGPYLLHYTLPGQKTNTLKFAKY